MGSPRIFISHSHKDEALAHKLRDLIRSSLALHASDIRCTSLDGSKFVPGMNVHDALIDEIANSKAFIVLLTKESNESKYVYLELGARLHSRESIFPVLVDDILPKELDIFLNKYQCIQLTSKNEVKAIIEQISKTLGIESEQESVYLREINELLKVAHDERHVDSSSGIISADILRASRRRIGSEVFAIELLREPIILNQQNGRIKATIDRRNVEKFIITTAGKTAACMEYVTGKREKLEKLDKEIQQFLVGDGKGDQFLIDLKALELPLRWASGGVMSIITFRGREWVPLFFRDIRPYGWNLSLGSSERRFDKNGSLQLGFNIDDELDDPLSYMRREFLEESLVINGSPFISSSLACRHIFVNPRTLHRRWLNDIESFAEAHALQRHKEDGIRIKVESGLADLKAEPVKGNVEITGISASGKKNIVSLNDVLISFSLLDLGIEVVEVIEYSIDNDDYLLDGEILVDQYGNKELIRMPIALLSCEYLARVFGKNQDWCHYTGGREPSIEVIQPPSENDVHLFEWDVVQRVRIAFGLRPSIGSQSHRYLDWHDKFGKYFTDRKGNPSSRSLPGLFVPATAKLLNQYFSKVGVFEKYVNT